MCAGLAKQRAQNKCARERAQHRKGKVVSKPVVDRSAKLERVEKKNVHPPKGSIALLQEFVQNSKAYPLPSNCSVLQYTYETRMPTPATLEYRALLAFFIDGVPHHVASEWQGSKKGAQRDAADRALNLFAGRGGGKLPKVPLEASDFNDREDDLLERFCSIQPMCEHMKWCMQQSGTRECVAVVELCLHGVPHKLAGAPKGTEKEARIDAAQRALWYLQCHDFEDLFEPEPVITGSVPSVGSWLNDDANHEAIDTAHRKTALMRTQKRLQQIFSQRFQGALEWIYETDNRQCHRATVWIPVLGLSFSGGWTQGQCEAQIITIQRVNAFLDQVCASSIDEL